MREKRKLQYINLIIFLIFALIAGVTACLSLFNGAKAGLQIAWTAYLLVGMTFLFFIGGKIRGIKIIQKYVAGTKIGRILVNSLFFLGVIGAGMAFRIWDGIGSFRTIEKNSILQLVYYFCIGVLVYVTVKKISGFKGAAAAIILIALCPAFDFHAEFSLKESLYPLLVFAAIFFIAFANYFVEKRAVSVLDALLTMLGAISLAGATFLHTAAAVLMVPCIWLLIRKSGVPIRGKREQRGLRSLLFEVFYICSLLVIFLAYTTNVQRIQTLENPIDRTLFHAFGSIGQNPMQILGILSDKFAGIFALGGQIEYYNGLLMGMLILGIVGAVLLFRKKEERRYFPIYLFNMYFFFSIFTKETVYNGLILYVLLTYVASGAMKDLSDLIFKEKGKEPEEADEPEELDELEEAEELEESKEEDRPEETEAAIAEETVEEEPEEAEEEEAEEEEPEEVEVEEVESEEPEPAAEEVVAEEEPILEETAEEESVEEEPEEAEEETVEENPTEKELVEEEPAEEEAEEPAEEELTEEESVEEEPAEEEVEEPEEPAEEELTAEEVVAEKVVAEEEPILAEPDSEKELQKVPVSKEPAAEDAVSEHMEPVRLEQQMDELIKREDKILSIVEKQSAQISKLEEELREQRIRARKMERHYRKELAISRNKKR